MSKVIILDPGHGGSDPGAVGNGLKEKDLNLVISLATRGELAGYDCTVKMARTKDVYVALSTRAVMGKGADLFVSQHNNAFTSNVRGFETYCHSGTLLAPTLKYRDALHAAVYPYLKDLGAPDRGKKRYDHYITRMPPCPVVLMEYLYVTNPMDAALLKKTAVLKELGRLTAVGIAKALGLKKKVAPPPVAPDVKMPTILKPVGVRIENKDVGLTGYYSDVGTMGVLADVFEKAGGKVTGHGESVNVTLPKTDLAAVKKLETEIARLKADLAAANKRIDNAKAALR